MPATSLKRTAAVLIVLVLLAAAAPAAAALEKPAGETSIGSTVFETLSSWLTALWAGIAPTFEPESALETQSPGSEVPGTPQGTSGGPTADPELGSDADPNG